MTTSFDRDTLTRDLTQYFSAHWNIPVAVSARDHLHENILWSPEEIAVIESLSSVRQKDSWQRARAALKQVMHACGDDQTDTTGLSFPHPRYSLTHHLPWAFAIGHQDPAMACGIGIDFQPGSQSRPLGESLYLTEPELAWLESQPEHQRLEHSVRLWTIKEAAFKATLQNTEMVLRQYALDEPDALTGHIRLPEPATTRIHYASFNLGIGSLTAAIARPLQAAF